ncbi:MAG TPA: hypothetical protein PLB41_11840 [Rubrivivax sp.]|nr:hypothetical protein [Rubrivivax sp.]HPO19250.1 hypothetical protein [Rubrivivax sp.]
MSDTLSRWLVCTLVCSSAAAAQAQDAASAHATRPAARPDPLDAKAVVPAPHYRSAFARFRAFGDDNPVSWREANEAVARIGGWRVYAREAQQPGAQPSGAAAPASPASPTSPPAPTSSGPGSPGGTRPMPPGHGGHEAP